MGEKYVRAAYVPSGSGSLCVPDLSEVTWEFKIKEEE
jgi:hypothetical protein